MKILCLPRSAHFAVILLALTSLVGAQPSTNPGGWFETNPAWATAGAVTWNEADARFTPVPANASDPAASVLYLADPKLAAPQLRTRAYIGDKVVRMEFLLPARSSAGVYFSGRYLVQLSAGALGAVGPRAEATTSPAESSLLPALVDAAVPAGQWQTLEARFRAPRFDEARNKTEHALLVEVTINGKVVQANTVQTGWSRGSEMNWEDQEGPVTVGVSAGSMAIRDFSVRRADFAALKLPAVSGKLTNGAQLVDFVAQGEETFKAFGCVECHATKSDDASLKTGPNLWGLFTLEARDRAIASGGEGHRFTIKTDRAYLHRSLRTPHDELAIAEHGPTTGQPYLPVMPPYDPTVLSEKQVDALGSYLATLNEPSNQGPVVRLVKETGPENYDTMADRLQMLVDRTVRIHRGPMERVSGRAIHVGLVQGINYSFDPRVLAIAKVWQGGFLDLSGELLNRGGRGLKIGYESREIDLGAAATLLAPLHADGKPVDFSFKEPKFQDREAVRESLHSPVDHLARLAAVDAQFLGYARDSRDPAAAPTFNYRVGRNTVALRTEFAPDGQVRMIIAGEFATPQTFLLNTAVVSGASVSAGQLTDNRWVLPAGRHTDVIAQGRLVVAPNVWRPKPSTFDYRRQPLVIEASKPSLPSGYRAETYLAPKDNYGRDQLFEALGLSVAPDGTVVVATRTAGLWRLVKGEWHLFAEGLFDSLGVVVEDEHGLTVVASQKAEVTRVADTNGDGLADTFTTLTDAFSYTGNYHAYVHGPVRAPNGDYFITLNLADAGSDDSMFKAGGQYMGTGGGFRGWAARVPAQGGFEPWASGLRSPAGLGFAPDGRLWYADNQGEYMGTSKLFVVNKDDFYGHPAGLVDRPGMTPASPEIAWPQVMGQRAREAVLFPQSRLANSPGNPGWDTTGGRFGPFAGQMFIGDQTQSNLMRVITEKVGDHEQGVVIPFATDLESGVMRPLFLPDGSLLLGQTGRGWQARGGRVASLQRLVWDGKTKAPMILDVQATPAGFALQLAAPVPAGKTDADVAGALEIKSWVYRDAPDYGSRELDQHPEAVTSIELAADRKSLHIVLAKTAQPQIHPQQTARVYQLSLAGKTLWGEAGAGPGFEAFYTLNAFPAAIGEVRATAP